MAPTALDDPTDQGNNAPPIEVKQSSPKHTEEDLDWAELPKIDLSQVGFWSVVNTGLDDDRVLRQFSIGNTFFKEEEKRRYPCNFAEGEYFGYRENSRWIGDTGIKANMEMLNIPKPIPEWSQVGRHRIVQENYDERAAFHRDVWEKVARKLFEEDKAQAYSKSGHTDFGSLTLLFSQHVAGLQIQTPEGDWKYVKPVDGGITCDTVDTLSFPTNDFIKSTVYRVMKPPQDQLNLYRLGLLYFSRPGASIPMKTVPFPLLDRLGLISQEDKDPNKLIVTSTDYVRARVKDVHHKTVIDHRKGTTFEFKGLKVNNHSE